METGRTEVLSIKGVSHHFNQLKVLEDITFSIYDGEVVCILGPSGCGKTTLLRIVAGLIACQEGDIRFDTLGANKDGNPGRNIGMVFQEPRLLPWRTAASNVGLPFELAGIKIGRGERESISTVLKQVDLADFASAYPHQLSGGMRQRVSLARALVTNPYILLMDEPLTGLDVNTKEELQGEIVRIWQARKMSLLWVTHDPAEAVYMADRVIVFSSRPARVKAIVDVALARPRLRNSQSLIALEQEVRRFLM